MESLDQLHRQLDSLDELRTIVRTMKALSAASIRQYEQAVTALSGYYRTVERGLHVVLRDLQQPPASPPQASALRRFGAVVFGSDHGLCGRFNEEIGEYVLERMNASGVDTGARSVLAVGARVAGVLEHAGQPVRDTFPLPGSAPAITATVQRILLRIDAWREQAGVENLYLFYNRHSGEKNYQPVDQLLLPVGLERFRGLREQHWPSRSLPTFSMPRERLLSRLLRQYLFVSIFRACAESQAGEHASRLAAMQSAERNLDERLDEVSMTFRRARQNTITSELLDVVAGFEAISSGSG